MPEREEKTNSVIMKTWHFFGSQAVILVTVLGAIFGSVRIVLADLDIKYDKAYYSKSEGEELKLKSDRLEESIVQLTQIAKKLSENAENSDKYHSVMLHTPFKNGEPVDSNYLNNNAFNDLKKDVDNIKNHKIN